MQMTESNNGTSIQFDSDDLEEGNDYYIQRILQKHSIQFRVTAFELFIFSNKRKIEEILQPTSITIPNS